MLERFIDEYSPRGYRFAYHLCGDPEEAKELVQEAFFRVISRWDQYDPSQPLENWFLTILRNVYYDGLRRFERRNGVSLDAPRSGRDPEEGVTLGEALSDRGEPAFLESLQRQEEAAEVREVLAGLTPEHKAVLTLCDMEGLGYDQIAVVLDCPVGTVRSRVSRARAAFRKRMLERRQEVVHDEL